MNAETPDPPAADGSAATTPVQGSRTVPAGPIAEFGLVAAGLGLVIYLIGFVADLGGASSPILPLLLGGGLLAGTVALPTVGGRVLAPAAVATTTGALLLLHEVVLDGGTALVIGALVLGLLEAAAAIGATLMHAGALRSRPRKARRHSSSAVAGHAGGPRFPGQQYPGQPYPGAFPPVAAPRHPDDQWTGEHAYGQNAQYGGQYGVPGYPPPPPYATPGYGPAPHGGEVPTGVVHAEAPGDTASPPPGTRPVADVPEGTGAHRAGHDGAVPGTGSFPSAVETSPVSGSPPGAAGRRSADDGGHTRSLPVVPDEQR